MVDNMEKNEKKESGDQAAPQATQQARLRVDERKMENSYANAFRTNGGQEEVMLDFGINQITPAVEDAPAEILLQISSRVILNYYTAKRLALTLSQLIRRHEEQFGELELDVNKRLKSE